MSVDVNENTANDKVDQQAIDYSGAISYWNRVPPTVDGMLGGFGFISSIDIQGSEQFLKGIFKLKHPPGRERAIDCGAGIGRITKHLLVNFFKKIDLVEPCQPFIDESRNYIQRDDKVDNLHNVGLQDFKPNVKYDVIWCQWVLSQLSNAHLVSFFDTCRNALSPNGVIVVKENIATNESGDVDEVDQSRTRPEKEWKQLFVMSKLQIVKECKQTRFPVGLYQVKMYALRPNKSQIVKTS